MLAAPAGTPSHAPQFIFRPAIYLQHTKRLSVTLQDDVHGAMYVMLFEYVRRSEAFFDFEMIGNNRLAGSQGKSRRRSKISADACNTHCSCDSTPPRHEQGSYFPSE